MAILLPEKVVFRTRNTARDKEGYYINNLLIIHQEDRTIICRYMQKQSI